MKSQQFMLASCSLFSILFFLPSADFFCSCRDLKADESQSLPLTTAGIRDNCQNRMVANL